MHHLYYLLTWCSVNVFSYYYLNADWIGTVSSSLNSRKMHECLMLFSIINHTYKPSGLNNSRRRHLQSITWADNTNDAWCNLRPVMSTRLCLHAIQSAFNTTNNIHTFQIFSNHIGVVMASVLVSSAINRGFEHRSGKHNVYTFCSSDFMYWIHHLLLNHLSTVDR
jgi:hypothetical protein